MSNQNTRIRPPYFDDVREAARRRWDQLEEDPELAGPWRLLFSQVQSPRHVLSELLQNADDAGASTATAKIVGERFVFTHDGGDFDAEQFASLCRFGFSNKRTLHTIGFRGIGFKSTFSLGDSVEVCTPTLAVRFDKHRFTEPVWMETPIVDDQTWVRVAIKEPRLRAELEKNLCEWAESPTSLLFFANIRKLVVSGKCVEKRSLGPGPVSGSEKFSLLGGESDAVLLIRSEPAPFPGDALEEIRQERNVAELDLPPCRVEVVLGLTSPPRLFVVLPTGVRPSLPFSCNAPFLQDPARTAIKDPSTSPTNCWLLRRIGELARRSMYSWLSDCRLSMADRAKAYALLPRSPSAENTVDDECTSQVCDGFSEWAEDAFVLLTSDGTLSEKRLCLAPPPALYSIWAAADILSIFGGTQKSVLASEVPNEARDCLTQRDWLDPLPTSQVLDRLTANDHVSKPDCWQRLLRLWHFVETGVRYDVSGNERRRLHIVPIDGQTNLYAADNAVRLPSNRSALRGEDWSFVNSRISVLDDGWTKFLAEADERSLPDGEMRELVAARHLLGALRLDSPSGWEKVLAQAAAALFLSSDADANIANAVRLAHIFAALNVQVPDSFRFAAQDSRLRTSDAVLVFDADGDIDALIPESWGQEHLLHENYSKEFSSCTAGEWRSWAASEKSRLTTAIPIQVTRKRLWRRNHLEEFLRSRGGDTSPSYPYKNGEFEIDDYDFPEVLVSRWENLAADNPTIWSRITRSIANDPRRRWASSDRVRIRQFGYSHSRYLDCGDVPASWLVRLRDLKCLRDTYGALRYPAELLLRTPNTEPLMGVEPFVEADIDTEATKQLLMLLGVRDTPSGVDKLLDRIRALATVASPPVHEVAKWYDALDRVLARCRPDDLAQAKQAFGHERLVLTEDCQWAAVNEVFLLRDEAEADEASLIHLSVRNLAMWTRLDVAERPTADLIIDWLRQIETDSKLDGRDLKRVRAALQRHPLRVWHDCGHWLNLENVWAPVDSLSFRLTMQALTRFGDFFPAIKAKTADLRMLPAEVSSQSPYRDLRDLGPAIEYRIVESDSGLHQSSKKPWLHALGRGLARVRFDTESESAAARATAERMAKTVWQACRTLRIVPYIDGTPAGPWQSPQVQWYEQTLYVQEGPVPKRFNALVDALSRPFNSIQVADAIKACAERDPAFVDEYLAAHFELNEHADSEKQFLTPQPECNDAQSGDEVRTVPDSGDEPLEGDGGSDEPIADEQFFSAREDCRPHRTRSPSERPHHLPLFDRYAAFKQFQWDTEGECYYHDDGRSIRKGAGLFNWELFSPTGDLIRRLWATEQSLSNGGIEIASDLWEAIRAWPSGAALILKADDGRPTELSGDEIENLIAREAIAVFPAKYRVRLATDE